MFKWIKRLIAALLLLGLLAAALYAFRAPLLRAAADAWIVNDTLTKADAIVVLGGGNETRPFAAAHLFQQGLAARIFLTNPDPSGAAQLGLTLTEAELARAILLKQSVPAEAIFILPDLVHSTYGEAMAVRHWAETNAVRRVIIATDVFHTRRAGWIFAKTLNPAGIQVTVAAVPVREYSVTNWWQDERGIVALQNELLKYAYYRAKY